MLHRGRPEPWSPIPPFPERDSVRECSTASLLSGSSDSADSADREIPTDELIFVSPPSQRHNRKARLARGAGFLLLSSSACFAFVAVRQRFAPPAHLRGMTDESSAGRPLNAALVDRAEEATGTPEFCGHIEAGVEYHTREPLYSVNGIASPAMCCAECDGDPQCGAWTWGRNMGWNGELPTCVLKKVRAHEKPLKIDRPGVSSGLQRLTKHGIVSQMLESQLEAAGGTRNSTMPAPVRDNETCRGELNVQGYGVLSVVNAIHQLPQTRSTSVMVPEGKWAVLPHLKSRAFFAESCAPDSHGHPNQSSLASLKLLGKAISYSTDLSGVGCGCDSKLHLIPARAVETKSDCDDFLCGVESVCGRNCAELGLQDANQYAWSSTMHLHDDHHGVGAGYGGDRSDWTDAEYGPGAECIDTSWPFRVTISFPVDAQSGILKSINVTLSQEGHFCPLTATISRYNFMGRNGMEELSKLLEQGLTPFVSYASSADLAAIDGVGTDGRGPCVKDTPKTCPHSVRFFDFAINDTINDQASAEPQSQSPFDVALDTMHELVLTKAEQRRQAALANATHLPNVDEGPECGDCDTPGMSITDSDGKNGDDGGGNSSNNSTPDANSTYSETKEGNAEWKVVFSRLPVRMQKRFTSKILKYKLKGQVLQGKRVGDWVKLAHEPGYVAVSKETTTFLTERIVTYKKIASGTCTDHSMFPIRDLASCQSAAWALGYFDHDAHVYAGRQPRPDGCYLREGHLWMATNLAQRGNGVNGNRLPICGNREYPTTTTTTTSTITSTTSTTQTHTTTTSTTWGYPSLYCAAVMRRYGCGVGDCYEYGLMKAQVRHAAGIFLCDEYAVFSQDDEMSLGKFNGHGAEVITRKFIKAKVGRSDDGFAANTELFMNVWVAVRGDKRWADHHWTIKADPDAVVLPWRVRHHLKPFTQQTNKKNYVPNCNAFPNSPLFPMVYGSFEAFSKMAMEAYFYGNPPGSVRCKNELSWHTWGEDKFMGECMKHLGVSQSTDLTILRDNRCGVADCGDPEAAAFHDFKSIPEWFTCWGQATADRNG